MTAGPPKPRREPRKAQTARKTPSAKRRPIEKLPFDPDDPRQFDLFPEGTGTEAGRAP